MLLLLLLLLRPLRLSLHLNLEIRRGLPANIQHWISVVKWTNGRTRASEEEH